MWVFRIAAIVLLYICLMMPSNAIKMVFSDYFKSGFDFKVIPFMLVGAVLVALGVFAVVLINRNRGRNTGLVMAGYLLLIITSALPAIGMMQFDTSYDSMGKAYYSALVMAVTAWWGIALWQRSKQLQAQ